MKHMVVSSKDLYSPIVHFYDDLLNGLQSFSIDLIIEKDCNLNLLQDFLVLLEDGRIDFSAEISLTVTDNYGILEEV